MTSARHSWNEMPPQRIPACEAPDGNDRTEKTCARCGLVKITVHPPMGIPWNAWRTKAGADWQGAATPPCTPAPEPALATEVPIR